MKNATIAVAFLVAFAGAAQAMDPLHLLAQVNHLKAQSAEEQAAETAEKQRELLKKKEALRKAQMYFD